METNSTAEKPSKSQRKRDALAAQALGERLAALSPQQMSQLDLPEALREALETARQIHARGGHKRQLQLIGKLMRECDVEAISAQLAALEAPVRADTERHHRVERWRERLLSGPAAAFDELLQTYPGAERERLREMIQRARNEQHSTKPPRAARALFRYLRELDQQHHPRHGD